MADYFVGQGPISLAPRNSAGRTGGFVFAGDSDVFSVSGTEDFLDFNESYTGARARVVHVPLSRELSFDLSLRWLDATNLARALHGTVGTTAGATVTAEPIVAYNNTMVPLLYPNVSSVVINKAGTPLVANTDYTLDAVNGTIKILPGSTLVTSAMGAVNLTANYTYASYGGTVQALKATTQEYTLRFDGFSQTDNSPMIVTLHRVTIDLAGTISFIGNDVAALELSGALLPAGEISATGPLSQYMTIVRGA